MKKILHLLLIFVVVGAFSSFNPRISPNAEAIFPDVPGDHSNYTAINYVQEREIVEGYPDGNFRPDDQINRAEFLKIVVESTFSKEEIENCSINNYQFPDTPANSWFAPYICVGKKSAIISGHEDGNFRPASQINFVEAAKIITLAQNLANNSPTDSLTAEFPSETKASDPWYKNYVEYLGNQGAIPTSISSFDKKISRGEMAEIIYRIEANVDTMASHTYDVLAGSTSGTQYCIPEGCNEVTITVDANYRYISANNIPNHQTGDFPNSGNPNTITEQDNEYRVTLNPVKTNTATNAPRPGVSLNGVFFEPGTAERNGEWSYEAFQDQLNLGLDQNNAHVQPDGSYHYHGAPEGLITYLETLESVVGGDGTVIPASENGDLLQVGWASDGFPIWYSISDAYKSSYQIKSGTRPTSPYGNYDGTYTQDFEYIAGFGDLDECNGVEIDGEYGYLITQEFPYIQRCVFGTPDESFAHGPGALSPGAGSGAPPNGGPGEGPNGPGPGMSDPGS